MEFYRWNCDLMFGNGLGFDVAYERGGSVSQVECYPRVIIGSHNWSLFGDAFVHHHIVGPGIIWHSRWTVMNLFLLHTTINLTGLTMMIVIPGLAIMRRVLQP